MSKVVQDVKLDFKDVLILPKRSEVSSRSKVSLVRSFKFRSGQEYTGVPIMASNMDTVGTFEMAESLSKSGLFTAIHKHYQPDEWLDFATNKPEVLDDVAVSTGIGAADQQKLDKILELVPQLKYICIDVANGYERTFVEFIKSTRSRYPNKVIMAGNVVTGEMVEDILTAGADIVKIGIGPGSVCTTRKKTGCGRAQLTAILDCAEAAHRLGGHIISDGGCTVPGDVCKAFGAGADFVMLGGMLAGHDQCPGEVQVDEAKRKFKIFYGMASKMAQDKHNAGLATYRASEGKAVRVPYRGDVSKTVLDILGGLRSVCSYTGSGELDALSKNTTFERVTQQINEVFRGLETDE